MKRLIINSSALILLSIFTINVQPVLADLSGGTLSEGNLYWSDGGITAISDTSNTNAWASDSTYIHWEVNQNTDNTWRYSYTFSVPSKDISHFILEVSENFNISNLSSLTSGYSYESGESGDPRIYSPDDPGNSNPFLPDGGIFGIKFSKNSSSTTYEWEFDTTRAPMWGDFYAIDGKKDNTTPSVIPWAYNAGFGINTLIDDGKHIAVPDTKTVIPLPGAVLLGLLGISVAGVKIRRFV